ncbi:DUF5979 domain-containing protein [Coprococcus comes]|uniref:DUF5979 domain-containing protein n=1 Tax=Coprococcus comes TaxID=410072 RepID=UPI001D085D35|nr:DUF5979 domain-containing protein [Coprococcus comes]MCB6471094.1 DUF5979 domain-containing protein [Coprococcus comes]
MMNKRLKQGTTFLLALALAFPLLTLPGARAANAIETDRKCSVSFSVSGEGNELADAGTDIKVNLYKVADVDVSGNYTATGAFTELDVSSVRADNNDAASKWAARAKEAQKLLKDSVKPTTTVTLAAGTGSLADLATGLYLVDTPEVVTTNYTYTFTPYLVSLPTNNYYSNGNDTWIYDLTDTNAIGLKPEEHARYGDLKIYKTLANHNATTGKKTTFVFQIDITPRKSDKTETRIESLDFKAAGESSVTITKIPAGAAVKVTEVYSGASYKLTSANDQTKTTTIVATDRGTTNTPASVSFTNDINNNMNGGYGVKNNFKLDEYDQYQYTEPAKN